MQNLNNQWFISQINSLVSQKTEEVFLAPLIEAAYDWNRNLMQSKNGADDLTFLKCGVHRVLRYNESGRDFLQFMQEQRNFPLSRGPFFHLFQSKRRLGIASDTSVGLYTNACRRIKTDLLKNFHQLDGIEVIAGDGHLLAAACHSKRDYKGQKVPPNNLFMMNVRKGLMLPVATVQGNGRYGHELPVLRHHLPHFLQQQRRNHNSLSKVLMLLDPGFSDTAFWTNLAKADKQGALVVFPEKSNLTVYKYDTLEFDKEDPINTGVISYELVGFKSMDSRAASRVTYCDPETGNTYHFLTTAADLPPGLIALLYLLRWRIEKVFDTFKNKFHETKAWGNGEVCQLMQAHFTCITYNLLLLFKDFLKEEFGIEPIKLYRKRHASLRKRQEKAEKRGGFINPMLWLITIPSQISCQFIRSLRNAIDLRRHLYEHLPDFKRLSESYL